MENFKIPGKTPEEREIEVNAAIENLDPKSKEIYDKVFDETTLEEKIEALDPKSKELFDGVFEDTENLG